MGGLVGLSPPRFDEVQDAYILRIHKSYDEIIMNKRKKVQLYDPNKPIHDIKCATLNCKGMNRKAGRQRIVYDMEKYKLDVLLLQETLVPPKERRNIHFISAPLLANKIRKIGIRR